MNTQFTPISIQRYSLIALLILSGVGLLTHAAVVSAPLPERDRSPLDLALSPEGRWALTANATSDTVSLTDLQAGKVQAEIPVGGRPFDVAWAASGGRAIVSNWQSNTVSLLQVTPPTVKVVATIPVGEEPRGVTLTSDGKTAFVALGGDNRVAMIDTEKRVVSATIPVGQEPWHLALTPDGKRLVVGNVLSQEVSLVEVASRKVGETVKMRGHNLRHLAMAPDGEFCYLPHIAERGRPATKDNIDQGWIVGNRLSRVLLKEEGPKESLALDPRGKAVGDVDGCAVSPDGKTLAVTAGGTHELLLLRQPLPFVAYGGPGDHIELDLKNDATRFRRIPLGGRPLGVTFTADGKRVVIANYLSNALQVVDVEKGEVVQTVALGGPAKPSLARQGETLFLDATRSFHQWYSCNTCHVEGHTNGSNFDTLNDGSYDTPKKTPSLRGVTQTGPWTWHGWQTSLRQLVRDSFMKSMQSEMEPTDAELDALLAYLATLDFRPRRTPTGPLAAQVKRGEALFNAKGCDTCHTGPLYQSTGVYKVGLESEYDAYKGFNPPSLRGVGNRSPYLHTGSVRTLDQVLSQFHRPSELTGKPDLTPTELRDLVAFLQSL